MLSDWKNLLPQKCDWCPLMCGANRARGDRGLCGADDSLVIGRSALHFWEEPPISGIIGGPTRDTGPGSGTIFFANCSMKCCYCQNYRISGVQAGSVGRSFSPQQLVDAMLGLQDEGAMNINFVTGSHYRSHIVSCVRAARDQGLVIPIVWNSSGYETVASVSALAGTVDVFLPDFKYADDDLALELSQNKVSDYCQTATEAIETMLDIVGETQFDMYRDNARMTRGVIVRHMLLPDHLENSQKALEHLFDIFGNDIKYSIMNQYTPVMPDNCAVAQSHPELLHAASDSDYEELLDFADQLGIRDYYWQNGPACSESFIPEFH